MARAMSPADLLAAIDVGDAALESLLRLLTHTDTSIDETAADIARGARRDIRAELRRGAAGVTRNVLVTAEIALSALLQTGDLARRGALSQVDCAADAQRAVEWRRDLAKTRDLVTRQG